MWRELSAMKASDSRCHGEFWDRVAQADYQVPGDGIPFGEAIRDRRDLIAEVERLRASNAKLRTFVREQWSRVPAVPHAQAGSYYRGYDNGMADILRGAEAALAQHLGQQPDSDARDEVAK